MIEARIFYVGRGNSVLLRLGEPGCGRYGLVDCFCGHDQRHPILRYLERERVDTIEFLVLTHPHDDHFLGVSHILEAYGRRLRRLYDWGIDPRQIVVGVFNSGSKTDDLARKDLQAIERFGKSAASRGRIFSISSPGLRIYEDKDRGIVVDAVAPCGDAYRRVQNSLTRFFTKARKMLKQARPSEVRLPSPSGVMDLNLLSSAVQLTVGSNRLLLGGDVLRTSWNKLLSNGSSLPAEVVVLSHHGSHTGFPTTFWGSSFGKGGGIAIVSGEGLHQPSPSVVKVLKSNDVRLYTTSPGKHKAHRSTLEDYVARFHYKARMKQAPQQDLILTMNAEGTSIFAEPVMV